METTKPKRWKPVPYLNDTKAPAELVGLTPLLNAFADRNSSPRLTMATNHVTQSLTLDGCEHNKIFSGWESVIGEYEYNPTERKQDIQVIARIPRFITNTGAFPLKECPFETIIYRGADDNQINYFDISKYTMRSEGYGYMNKLMHTEFLTEGTYIPKEMKFSTSPAHDGNRYMMGTNLNTAYMSLNGVTEDAFIITESAAKKLASDGFGKMEIMIAPNQIPVNLYGDENEYKFLPDVGEHARADGILCALRTPTTDSFIFDTDQNNLRKVQYTHDEIIYVPKGAEIMDIDIRVNRKVKNKTKNKNKGLSEFFNQVQKYRDQINAYCMRVWDTYQQLKAHGETLAPAFKTLVVRCAQNLLADNIRVPNYNRKADVTLVRKKETIEFIYIKVTYRFKHKVNKGYKLAGLCGN